MTAIAPLGFIGNSRIEDIKGEFLLYLKDIGILHNQQAQSFFQSETIPSTAKMVFLLANYISELDPSNVFDLSQKIFENWRFKNARKNSEPEKRQRFKTYSVGNLKLLEKVGKETIREPGISFGIPHDLSNESVDQSTIRRESQDKINVKENIFFKAPDQSPTMRMRYSEKMKENRIPVDMKEQNIGTFGNETRTRTRSLMDFHKENSRIKRNQVGLDIQNQPIFQNDQHNVLRERVKENHESPVPLKESYEYERLMNLKQKINDIRERIQKDPNTQHIRRKSSHYRDSLTSLYKYKGN